jgi:hypothetical protein
VGFIVEKIGPSRAKNCQHVSPDSRCEKLEWSDPKICGICPYYTDKRALSKSERESNSTSVSTSLSTSEKKSERPSGLMRI